MYVVYTDALGEALRKLGAHVPVRERHNVAVNGRARPIRADDIRVVVRWWVPSSQWKTAEYSLRTDVPGRDDGCPHKGPVVTTRDRHEVQPLPELEELLGATPRPRRGQQRPRGAEEGRDDVAAAAAASAAPEPFVFEFAWEARPGSRFALYLPFVDGQEMSAAWNDGHAWRLPGRRRNGGRDDGPEAACVVAAGATDPADPRRAGFLQPKNPEAGSRSASIACTSASSSASSTSRASPTSSTRPSSSSKTTWRGAHRAALRARATSPPTTARLRQGFRYQQSIGGQRVVARDQHDQRIRRVGEEAHLEHDRQLAVSACSPPSELPVFDASVTRGYTAYGSLRSLSRDTTRSSTE